MGRVTSNGRPRQVQCTFWMEVLQQRAARMGVLPVLKQDGVTQLNRIFFELLRSGGFKLQMMGFKKLNDVVLNACRV